MSAILEIIIMLLILGVLVSIHEAGHLATAKLFKVYCFEYSIGMGPALIHKKKKGGETYFSLRAVPFGGYVSMYGEAEDIKLEEGEQLPPAERSLENIAKWKKAIIMVAGVFLNFVLGIVLIFLSVSIFPQYAYGNAYGVTSVDDAAVVFVYQTNDSTTYTYEQINAKKNPSYEVSDYDLFLGFSDYYSDGQLACENVVISSNVQITFPNSEVKDYVAVYGPSNLTTSHSIENDIYFYEPLETVVDAKYQAYGITKLPDMEKQLSTSTNGAILSISMKLQYAPVRLMEKEADLQTTFIEVEYDNILYIDGEVSGFDVEVGSVKYWNNWNQIWTKFAYYVPYCCGAIIKGIAMLFTPGGIGNLSGIVGMTSMVGTYSALGGASMLFLFAGLISINLAFFNLLPFPGLDGYQLVVTGIEGLTKKKVPAKVKNTISAIGLILLIVLMVVITIKDIINLF